MREAVFSLVCLPLLAACATHPPSTVTPPPGTVVVPAGWFWMGEDNDRPSNRPRHAVYLDAFAIDQTEVTNEAFAEFVAEAGYQMKGWEASTAKEHASHPASGVPWQAADAYCRWAGKRLPTEAEWEKAARGTDGRRYPWGETWEADRTNTLENGVGGPVAVGSFPSGASPYGALDMAGNVAEWVADYYDAAYYAYAPIHNPTGPDKVVDHVLRGGSWASPSEHAQTFFRDSSHVSEPNPRVGFRCVMTWPGGTEPP